MIMLMSTSVNAATPTKKQMEQFKSLPKAQQQALAKQMGVDISAFTNKGSSSELTELEPTIFPREEKEALLSEEEKYKPVENEIKPFGYELFAGDPTSFMPSEISAVPESYTVGRGDEFKINLYGKENLTHTVVVDREGRLSIPDLTPVFVAGLSFLEVKELVKSKISQEVIGVKAFVSLGQLRSMRIMVLGESFKPGSYTVSSLTTVSHALFVSGGVSDIGSLRNIQVKRAGKMVQSFDLYNLLINGDSSDDIMLKPGDVVFIPTVNKQVTISGLVKRPAIFELKNDETAQQLISMAGGFKAEAFPQKTLVERYSTNSFKTVLTLDFSQKNINYQPKDGDVIKVQASSTELENAVTLIGAVAHPGNYQWVKGDTVSDLISSLKTDVLPIADFDYSLIVREKNIKGDVEVIQFSLLNALNKQAQDDVKLAPRDIVMVFSRFEVQEDEKRTLSNMLLTEDEYLQKQKMQQWQDFENQKYKEYIGMELDPEITDKVEDSSLTALLKGKVEDIKEEELSIFGRTLFLKPLILKLQKQSSYGNEAELIAVNGKVRYPGVYPLVKNASMNKAMQAAGGLLESAYIENAEVTRVTNDNGSEIEHVTLNLSTEPGKQYTLKSKDTINIFTMPNWQEERYIQLVGEVKFPGKYTIKRGEKLSSILERAGGFTDLAATEAAIFTRESIRLKERTQLAKLANDLRREIATRSFQSSVTDSSLNYDDTNKLLNDLSKVEALGRLVIDLPSVYKGSLDVELQNNDTLYVPIAQSTINVIGEVNLAVSHLYQENISLEQYISRSGGLKQRGDRDRIYIIKANGSVQLPKASSWFAVTDATYLSPGDTIVVPLDTEHMDKLTLWSTASRMIFEIGSTLAVINSL
ncbi:SLBB domain-containing protein [Pseudoalteromonas sp. C2R02]|uniref:SLBB domain-containing protein n=1 Tax=Pseudoalteromonas sp. C2R02 TaxID=2841565 RepID=UPI001C08C2DC|nr:SLBB domain-containing protein [Pseudoalteromonas sp. C2R02]MBU2971766.1 SLBB domain-containing protein [Pseudoalteromonas sp. C2R02]